MSFSEDVRAELASIAPLRECDRLAELSALFHFAGRLHLLGRGEVAALAGHPNAQRAVGSVCASNRFGLVVPCHRVLAAGGLGSYGSLGTGYKRRLLELEGVVL